MKTKDLSRLSVDGVLCISLKDRKDRRLLLLETMKRSGLDIEFVLVDPDRENPARGCFNSHLKCAEIALQRNYSNVLILEDDALQYFFSKQTVRNINRFISTENFSILHLGYTMGKIWLTWNFSIARGRVTALHAYILSKRGCSEFVKLEYRSEPIDRVVRAQIKQHCVFPMMFGQQPAHLVSSDIEDIAPNDDSFWRNNWYRHVWSAVKNFYMTVLGVNR
ncbi:Glycosyltransferase family 25 (LPS biosynthesis protein) [Pseudomonas sp. NFACC32-1]|uniref:glycosyltransferase family 25 protein n=1 Tax=unclassified Pseudomonas TaxID=196821 RepID=UPI00087636DE|nr:MULTISPECIES: glycosyltransferase family 25 protein [unclassified Pseudomonas]SCX71038.1 Glycosyltransferase family 25 (LPS biosynthesis protein) [Pseudomonas sp. NFACC32-1]SFY21884.1 Glycosyltransferase family 25 (LPS biosynthesis protein) [Pseudomonas sp. NFACC49-2]